MWVEFVQGFLLVPRGFWPSSLVSHLFKPTFPNTHEENKYTWNTHEGLNGFMRAVWCHMGNTIESILIITSFLVCMNTDGDGDKEFNHIYTHPFLY